MRRKCFKMTLNRLWWGSHGEGPTLLAACGGTGCLLVGAAQCVLSEITWWWHVVQMWQTWAVTIRVWRRAVCTDIPTFRKNLYNQTGRCHNKPYCDIAARYTDRSKAILTVIMPYSLPVHVCQFPSQTTRKTRPPSLDNKTLQNDQQPNTHRLLTLNITQTGPKMCKLQCKHI